MPASSEHPNSAQGPKKPVKIGKYEVLQHLATGGMGAIYRARDTETDAEVALKILPPEAATKQALVVRFKREYAAASRMRHENIVALHEFGQAGNTLYFAMEFVPGIDLHEHIQKQGTVDPEEARQIVLQGARALRHASQHNIVHRDIKPSNFLLSRKAGKLVVKLTDFGLAREQASEEFRVTRAGTTVGTIDYMSPEQARDSSAADIRSDLYSLGATWYHLLTGQAPFPTGGLGERLIKIMNEEPTDARELNPQVSDETWAILKKLLEKDPADRHQVPEDLIADLLSLEGKAVARARPRPARAKPKKKSRSSAETRHGEAQPTQADASNNTLYYALGAGAGALLLVGVLLFFLLRGKKPEVAETPPDDPPPAKREENNKPKDGTKPVKKDGDIKKPPVKVKPPEKAPGLLSLCTLQPDALRDLADEVEKPWAGDAPAAARPVKVRRLGGKGYFTSLKEALASLPEGKPAVVEVHDNGPLFEAPASTAASELALRAGTGFRPLIIWRPPPAKTPPATGPLAFVSCEKGTLRVEGLDFAMRWPESQAAPGEWFRVQEGDLRLTDCTFSVAGALAAPVAIARVRSTREGTRCRAERCFGRGQSLAGLDVTAPAAEVLITGSLLSGQGPMVRLRASGKRPHLRVVRSTLAASSRLIEVPALGEPLDLLAWDSILARSGGAGAAEMLALGDGVAPENVKFRPVAAVYAGWPSLLNGPKAASTLDEWRAQWKVPGLHPQGPDAVYPSRWPDLPADENALRPPSAFTPRGKIAFACTTAPKKPTGCDLSALPPVRDDWLAVAFKPSFSPPPALSSLAAPPIPAPGTALFHGQRIEQTSKTDLGEYLDKIQRSGVKLGPRVVIQFVGKGDLLTSPIRVRGSTLVLHFEQDEKGPPTLSLTPKSFASSAPLIDVEGGDLEVIGGKLRCPESSSIKLANLVRVRGGDMRMYRTHLEGPRVASPVGYTSAIRLEGTKAQSASLNECVVVSNRACLRLEGPGHRLLLKGCALVAGEDALVFSPGAECKGRPDTQALLEHCTLAARRAVVRLADAPGDGPVSPAILQTRDCAFLNPFPGRPSKSGLLVYEEEAFTRGLLVWHSDGDAVDARLNFGLHRGADAIPSERQPKEEWAQLWGMGRANPRSLPGDGLRNFTSRGWELNVLRLRGSDPPGADLSALGVPGKR